MRFEIVTIFPGFFASIFENGIVRRALAEGLVRWGFTICASLRTTGTGRWTTGRLAAARGWC